MGFLQLLKQKYRLPVQTTQILQEQFMRNPSDIFLFFEDHVQVWNLDVQKRLHVSQTNQSIFFWSVHVPMTDTAFAFVSLENCEPHLGTYDFKTDKITKLVDLPSEQENYSSIFFFENSGEIAVDARGKEHRLLFWDGKEITQQKVDQNNMVEKYSNEALAIFSSQNKVSGFEIQRGRYDNKKYVITGIEEGSIVAVQEYSPSEAIIAVMHGGKTSTILLYSLTNGQVQRQEKIDFPVDNLVKLADNWIAMCTTEQQGNSTVKVQACFGDSENILVETEIERWIRYWNPYLPIVTLSHSEEAELNKQCHIEVVRCAPKRSVYIKMLEGLGITEAFGNEIVKATINNF